MRGHKRADRVANLIRQEIGALLLNDFRDGRLAEVSLTDVRVSDDLQVARLYYTVLTTAEGEEGSDEGEGFAHQAGLEAAAPKLRKHLGSVLRMKYVPKLYFHYDDNLHRARRIESILAGLKTQAGDDGGDAAIEPGSISGGSPELDQQLDAAARILRESDGIVVASHKGPDGDAIGSVLGLANLLWDLNKVVYPYNRDGVPYNFAHLPGADRVLSSPQDLPSHIGLVVVLDCSSLERVDPNLTVDRSRTRLLCIDHHETIDREFADVLVHDEQAAAVGELIYRLIRVMGLPLTRGVAECLFAAIQTDTGSFRYSNTTPAALSAASELVRAGIDVWRLSSETYENHPLGRVKLLGLVLDTLEVSSCGRFAFLTVTQEMYRATNTGPEMLDGFINLARGIRGVEVAAQLREIKDRKYKVSLRSRGRVNVAELAERFEGGGHHNAAGFTLEDSAPRIIDRLTREFQEVLDGP